jgi:hypothetical protein
MSRYCRRAASAWVFAGHAGAAPDCVTSHRGAHSERVRDCDSDRTETDPQADAAITAVSDPGSVGFTAPFIPDVISIPPQAGTLTAKLKSMHEYAVAFVNGPC